MHDPITHTLHWLNEICQRYRPTSKHLGDRINPERAVVEDIYEIEYHGTRIIFFYCEGEDYLNRFVINLDKVAPGRAVAASWELTQDHLAGPSITPPTRGLFDYRGEGATDAFLGWLIQERAFYGTTPQ